MLQMKKALNMITLNELARLDGIGKATAFKIIEYRNKNNGFKSLQELKNIDKIGEEKAMRLAEQLKIIYKDLKKIQTTVEIDLAKLGINAGDIDKARVHLHTDYLYWMPEFQTKDVEVTEDNKLVFEVEIMMASDKYK